MNISSISALAPSAGAPKAAKPEAGAESFGAMLADLGRQTVSTIKQSETTSIAALQGQASVQDVVMTTLAAEQSLQAAVAVRDKLVSALNSLTNMQI